MMDYCMEIVHTLDEKDEKVQEFIFKMREDPFIEDEF
jgi:hypothetical protein